MSCAAGWTYSQFDRILRPLRNRCNALATFSRRSLTSFDDLPPLSIFPCPDTVGFRVRLNKQQVKTLELSRRIYTVRDSFKTFLGKVLGNNTQYPPPARVITLADLCATIVGSRLEAESDYLVDLFEAIPSQYQRKAVVAHALDLVLQLCPRNHTLLLLLLELALSFQLASESATLLQIILTAACSCCPDTTTPCPPLCHPAHRTFLVDLCDRWTSSGQPTTEFVCILMRTANVPLLWSCEAMNIFLIKLARDDVTTYMSSLYLLSQMLSDVDPPPRGHGLYSCLQLWFTTACTTLLMHKDDHAVDHVPVLLHHISLLLESCNSSGKSDDMTLKEIKKVSICLATHWLSRNRLENAQYQLRRIKDFLSGQTPSPTTFNALVIPIIASEDLPFVKDKIQENACVLRSCGLLQYEFTLWRCTLDQIESPKYEQMLSSSTSTEAVRDFRFTLVDRVDDAEKRWLQDSDEWVRDPTFTCFVRKLDRKRSRMSIKPERYSTKFLCSGLDHSSPVCSESSDSGQLGAERESDSLPKFVTLVSQAIARRVVLHQEERSGHPTVITTDPESDDILNSFYYDQD